MEVGNQSVGRAHVSPHTRLPSRWAIGCLAAGLFLLVGVPLTTGCSDSTGPGACELVFVLGGDDPNPDTRLHIVNTLDTGLAATVSHEGFVDTGADMAPGECAAWGVFADVFQVSLQRCNQDEAGSTRCTSTFGPEVVRNVTVADGETVTLRVTPEFF